MKREPWKQALQDGNLAQLGITSKDKTIIAESELDDTCMSLIYEDKGMWVVNYNEGFCNDHRISSQMYATLWFVNFIPKSNPADMKTIEVN